MVPGLFPGDRTALVRAKGWKLKKFNRFFEGQLFFQVFSPSHFILQNENGEPLIGAGGGPVGRIRGDSALSVQD